MDRIDRLALATVAAGLVLWALICMVVPASASTWRHMPPERYQGTATAFVVYHPADTVRRMCGRRLLACGVYGAVIMTTECGKGSGFETVNVRDLMRDESYCASVKAHEFGHVNGWSAAHER